jgi:hypothetical protein
MVVVMENVFVTFLKTSRDEYPKDVYMFVLK